METTFISIHDLSGDARLLYASDSITDILGYVPQEVTGRSCFDYFHPDEIPFARSVHGKGVQLDKAAVLNYCRIRSKSGHWVGCECAFTVVYDVLVACTSIYRRGLKSQKRALDAPMIRRLFSSSPQDPRYHMLTHLSTKFVQTPSLHSREPRAALFLNRFTRTLAIMYSTTSLARVLGLTPDEAKGKSFYECIQENCLPEAIRCLESAKANDSIAYMRFWFRDPRHMSSDDQQMRDSHSSDEDDDGGVHISAMSDEEYHEQRAHSDSPLTNSRSSSRTSADINGNSNESIFGEPRTAGSSSSSILSSETSQRALRPRYSSSTASSAPRNGPIEVEAVISCTSDGLVVILRRARPVVPPPDVHTPPPAYTNGLFASPWAATPIVPRQTPPSYSYTAAAPQWGSAPQMVPGITSNTGPPVEDFMQSIREVAVFAWSLTGINGSLVRFSRGSPCGESQPPDGMPVWEPTSSAGEEMPAVDHYRRNGRLQQDYPMNDGALSDGLGTGATTEDNSMAIGGIWQASRSPAREVDPSYLAGGHGGNGEEPRGWF